MSKILIHSIVFSPDGVSTAYLYNDIALKFQEVGHEVVVLTTTPHYNIVKKDIENQPLKSKLFGLYSESNFHGIIVKHIPQKKFHSTIIRMLGFVYWHFASFILGLFEKKVDVIISPSPPLTIGVVNIALAKLKSAKVIYNVQEIYPDLLIEGGGLKSKPIISILRWIEKFIYKYSDKVTTIDEKFHSTIKDRFKDVKKLSIIPNFVDTSIYKPIEIDNIDLDTSLFPNKDSLKLMYAGNIGNAQDWIPLIEVAKKIKHENIEFFIIGEGVMREFIQEQIILHSLTNIHVIHYQPRELMPQLIAYSDIQFVFMSSLTENHGFPSKVYTIMACAKPLLVSSGENTPIVNFLKDKGNSYLITEKSLNHKVNKIIDILLTTNKDKLQKMGRKGLAEVELGYSKEVVTEKYVQLINSMLK